MVLSAGIVCLTLLLEAAPLHAQDIGAIASGNWNNSTIWTSGSVPGAGNNVYIGSNYPSGAVLSASIALTQNQQAQSVYLGYSTGSSGILDLGSSTLAVGNLYVGYNGTGSVLRSTGSISATNLSINSGSSFSFGSGDTVSGSIDVETGAILNTQNYNSTTNTVYLGYYSSSTGTLNLGSSTLTVGNMYVGYNGTGIVTRTTGSISATNFYVNSGSSFSFGSGDAIVSLSMTGGSATTAATSNITSSVGLNLSTLTLGADLLLSSNIDIENGSTLNAQGHNITANQIQLGTSYQDGAWSLTNRGNLNAPTLSVYGQALNLTASDNVQYFNVSGVGGSTTLPSGASVYQLNLATGASATTSAIGNVTNSVSLNASAMTLGADLSLSSSLDIEYGSILNAQNHNITAYQIYLGWNAGNSSWSLTNRGNLNATYLYVYGQTLNLTAADSVQYYYLSGAGGSTTLQSGASVNQMNLSAGASATISTGGSAASNISLNFSTLTLGADLSLSGTLSGTLDVENGSIVNAQGHNITANEINLGWNTGNSFWSLTNRGNLNTTYLFVYGQSLNLTASDSVQYFYLSGIGGKTTLASGAAIGQLTLSNYASAATNAIGNVTSYVSLSSLSTLTLGADLSLSGSANLDVESGSTVNAQHHNISAYQIFLGWYTGSAWALTNRGNLNTPNLYVNGQALNLTASDSVQNFYLSGVGGSTTLLTGAPVSQLSLSSYASATTNAVGNITNNVTLDSSSTLTLGADLSLSGAIDVRNGSTLNAQNHNISAYQVFLGWYNSGNYPNSFWALTNRGNLNTTNLYVNDQAFNLTASDNVQNFYLSGPGASTTLPSGAAVTSLTLYANASAITSGAGNIVNSVYMDGASSLTLGADLSFTGSIDVRNGSTINAQHHNITANQIFLGWNVSNSNWSLTNRGNLNAAYLYVDGQTLNLTASDSVQNFYLSGPGAGTTLPNGAAVSSLNLYTSAIAATTGVGNIASSVYMDGASSLTLGADLSLSSGIDVRNGSTINAQNHDITASQIFLGWNVSNSNWSLTNRGNLNTANLYVDGQALNLTANDSVQNFYLSGPGASTMLPAGAAVTSLNLYASATATTSAVGNIISSVYMEGVSSLTLGADLSVSSIDMRNRSTLNAQNHNLTANQAFLGWYSSTAVIVQNLSAVNVGAWYQASGTQITLKSGSSSIGYLNLTGNSNLFVNNGGSNPATLNILGVSTGDLNISTGSQLILQLNRLSGNPILSWANPASGDHVADLNALIAAGELSFTGAYTGQYSIYTTPSITYIATPPIVWTGSTSNSWATGGNWTGGSTPAGGDGAVFNNLGNGHTTISLGGAVRPIGAITFDTNAAAYTLGSAAGDTLLFDAGGAFSATGTVTVTSSVATVQTFSAAIQTQGALTITNNGTGGLTFNGPLTLGGGTAGPLTFSGTGTTTYAGNISTGAYGLLVQGTGTVILSGMNSYAGGTTISSGTLQITGDTALGAVASAVYLTGGALQFAAGGGIALNSARGIVLGGGTFDTNSGNDAINGVVSGANLIKNGAGTLTLSNANTYTNGTTIMAGTLAANNTSGSATGTGSVVVDNGTLAGIGSVVPGTGNSVTVNNGGTIRGGVADGVNNWGTLGVGNSLAVLSGGAILTEVNRTGANHANAGLIDLSSSPAAIFGLGTAAASLGGANVVSVNVLDTHASLVAGETYAINLVKAYQANPSGPTTTNFQLNGNTYYAGETIDLQTSTGLVGINGFINFSVQNNVAVAAGAGWSIGVSSNGQFLQLTLGPVFNWTGAVSALWTGGGNWSSGLVPVSGTTALFNQASSNTTISLGGATQPIGSIAFATSACAAYTLGSPASDAFKFDAGGNVTVANTVSNPQTFNAAIQTQGALNIINDGTAGLTFNGPLSLGGGTAGLLFFSGSGTTTYAGNISTGANGLFVQGPGTVVLSGTNSYIGATTISSGAVLVANNTSGSATGAGNVVVNGTLAGIGSIVPGASNNVTVNSGGSIRGGAADGVNNWGTLGIGNNLAILAGGTVVTEVNRTGVNQVNASLVNLASSPTAIVSLGTVAVPLGSGNAVDINVLDTSTSLVVGETYTINLVQAYQANPANPSTTNFRLNGSALAAGQIVDSQTGSSQLGTNGYLYLSFGNNPAFAAYTGWSIGVSPTGQTLRLTLAPVFVWTGAVSGLWTTAGNWNSGFVPVSGMTALFNQSSPNTTISLGGTAQPIGSIAFDLSTCPAYTIGSVASDALMFDAGGKVTVTSTVVAAQTFAAAVQTRGALTITNNGTGGLTFNGPLTLGGDAAGMLTFAGTGTTTYAGNISTGANGLLVQGAGTVILSGTNSYTGGTSILSGTLNIGSDNALGTANGAVHLTGGVLQFAASGAIALNSARGIVLGGGTFDTNSGNDAVNGVISGSNLIKNGLGTLTLTNANTYAGGTLIMAGALAADNASGSATGTGNVAVNGTLAGIGSVVPSAGNSVMVNTGGTIRGGVADGTHNFGTLGVGGGVTVNTGGTILTEVNRTSANQASAGLINLSSAPAAIFSLGTAAAPLGAGNLVDINVLDTNTSLMVGETYTINLVKAYQANPSTPTTTNFQLNGGTLAAGQTIDSQTSSSPVGTNGLISLTVQNNSVYLGALTGWSLGIDPTGAYLQLTLNPSPNDWTGSVSGLWTVPGNWNSGLVPVSGVTALFNRQSTNTLISLGGAAQPIGSIKFDTAACAAYTLGAVSGDAFKFDASGKVIVTNTVVTAQTFNAAIQTQGALTITNNGTGGLTFNGALTLSGGTAGLLTLSGTGTTSYAGNISTGVNSVLVQGPGAVILSGTNSYNGGVTISSGTLNINSDSALGAANGAVNLNGGTLQFALGATVALNSARSIVLGGGTFDTNAGSDAVNGVISGTSQATSNLIKTGAGTLTLNNTNTYAGSTMLNNGSLTVSNGGSLGGGALIVDNVTPASATPTQTQLFLFNSGQTVGPLSGTIAQAASGNTASIFLSPATTLTVNQTAAGTYQGTIIGGGNLALAGTSNNTLTLTSNSFYTGSTTIDGGTLQLAVANALPTTTSLTLGSGGTLNLNNNNQTLAALNSSAGNINTGTGTGGILTVGNTAGGTVTYSGVISGTGGLTWGIVNTNVPNPTPTTLALTSASTSTGPMTINTGTLSIMTTYALSGGVAPVLPYNAANTYPGAFTLGPTATLLTNGFNLTVGSLGGGGPIGGNINLGNNSNSTLYIVQSSATGYAGIISGTGNVFIVNGGNLAVYGNWTLTGGVTHDVSTLTGNHSDSPQSYLTFATSGSLVATQGIEFAGFTDQASTIYGGSAGDNNGSGTFVDATGDGGKLVLSYYAASVANGGPANGSGGTQNFSGFFANDVGLIFDAGYFGTAQQLTLSGPNNTTGPLTIGFTNQTTPQNGAASGAQSGVMNQVIISAASTFGAVTVGNLAKSNLINNLTVLAGTGSLTAASLTIGDAFSGSTGNNSVTVGGTLTAGAVNIGNTNLYGANLLTILSTGTVKVSGAIVIGNDNTTAGTGTLMVGGALGTTGASVTALSVQAGGVLAGYGTITVSNTGSNVINVTNGTIRGGFDDGVNQLGMLTIAANSGATARTVLAIQGFGSSGLGQTGAILTEVLATSSTAATNSKINITGANMGLNLNTLNGGAGTAQINIILYDPTASLTPGGAGGATYTFVLATVATANKIQLSGATQTAGAQIDTGATLGAGSGTLGNADLYIIGASQTYISGVTSWSLFIDSTGKNLELSVTSTPEPEHILLMCVGVLLAGFAIWRRWTSSRLVQRSGRVATSFDVIT